MSEKFYLASAIIEKMNDELHLIGQRKGLVVRNCIAKLRHFCEYDAFPYYDLVGYQYEAENDQFQNQLLSAANKAMMARSPRKAWAVFLDKPLPFLKDIPVDVDLVESSNDAYAAARKLLYACYLNLTGVNYITDMAASKMLYLKRPQLVAISDSYVREALAIRKPDTRLNRASYFAEQALTVSDSVRDLGKANLETLSYLQEELLPQRVSKARIIDILIWVDMAVGRGHPGWSKVAMEKRWHPIAFNL